MTHSVPPAPVAAIARRYRLDWRGVHGVAHRARVLGNGRALAAATGARADGAFALDAAGLGLLATACDGHTREWTHADATVQTCWDADRLDLGRVGITPNPDWLGSDTARARLDRAYARSVEAYEPAVAAVWGAHFSVR